MPPALFLFFFFHYFFGGVHGLQPRQERREHGVLFGLGHGWISRNGDDLRVAFLVGIGAHQHVLESGGRHQLGHGLRQHGFARAGGADHEHVAALFRRLLDDAHGVILAYDLVYQ